MSAAFLISVVGVLREEDVVTSLGKWLVPRLVLAAGLAIAVQPLGAIQPPAVRAEERAEVTHHESRTAREPAKERLLYVTNQLSNEITTFRVLPDGTLSRVGDLIPTGGSVSRGLYFSPDGRNAYTINGNDATVSAFSVGADGQLSRLGPPVPTGGTDAFGLAMAPDGSALYIANFTDSTVATLAISSDGTPHLVGEPVPTGAPNARGVAVSPNGRYVFVSHGTPVEGRNDVLVTFAVRPGHRLEEVGAPMPTGSGGSGVDVTPDGRFVYVTALGSDAVYGFAIGTGGHLTPVPGSPVTVPDLPEEATITPDGRHYYTGAPSLEVSRPIAGFTIGPDGSLTPVPGSPFSAGSRPVGINPSPDGRFMYVANFASHDISTYTIDRYGSLHLIQASAPTGGEGPGFQAISFPPNQGPTAAFTAEPGRTTRFDASHSTDPDGRIDRYDWDFGDGTVLPDAGPAPAYHYQHPGTYRVTLTVIDDEGCSTHLIFTGQSPLCNGTLAARSTARYSPHTRGRPTFLFHGTTNDPVTRATSSCICDSINPVVRWYRNGLSYL